MDILRHIELLAGDTLMVDLPAAFRGKHVEVTVRVLTGDEIPTPPRSRRRPPPELAGSMTLHDDLITPTAPEADWENA